MIGVCFLPFILPSAGGAYDQPGKSVFLRAGLLVSVSHLPSFCLLLHSFKRIVVNDCLMRILNVILWKNAVVLSLPLCQVAFAVRLLQEQVPRVINTPKHMPYNARIPFPPRFVRPSAFNPFAIASVHLPERYSSKTLFTIADSSGSMMKVPFTRR